jgi:hypothetical protein
MNDAARGSSGAIWVAWITCILLGPGCDANGTRHRQAQAPGAPSANSPGIQSGPKTIPANDPAADLYGDQGGEPVLSVDKAPSDAPLRARKGDTFFRLSNPRIETNRPGLPALAVDYERIRDGEFGGATLMIRSADGNVRSVLLLGPMGNKADTIEIEQHFPSFNGPAFPENLELFLVRSDQRYGIRDQPRFKVSNSAVRGSMPGLTLARNWTAEEAARLRQPPPNFNNANAYPNYGHDTPFAGDTTGGALFRFVDPKQTLLGVEYRLGAWDNEPCIGQLVPVFTRDQATTYEPRIIAREGYAVGGMNVQTGRFVDAVQLVFMKLTGDDRLDPGDRFTSDWIGYPKDGQGTPLGGDGRRVIGLHCRQGAILNALALVMDKAPAPGANGPEK